MKVPLTPANRARPRGFSLVELMIVVAIIGLLGAMALPAFIKIRQKSQNSRFISDLRAFATAFDSYSSQNGSWPPNAGTAVVPAGMTEADINFSSWRTTRNSVGGRWNWDRDNIGVTAAISSTGVTATDAQMIEIDAKIDDGDLDAGLFRKIGTRFVYVLQL